MLKLRKNKKGFTLVELIVVIAIMAVLAGVVAGVTVSQLNKQTDKTGQSQANTIAQFLSQCALTGEGNEKITEDAEDPDTHVITTTFASGALTTLVNAQYSSASIKVLSTGTQERGQIFVSIVPENATGADATHKGSIKINYKGKQSGTTGDVTYYVAVDGTITKA
ncbi:MAG: type II secretion system protein [Oscillospiraceae bacterium]